MISQHIGHTVIRIRTTPSTNNYASQQVAVNEVEDGTVFLSFEQTAGKGQLNNKWESEAGKNLTFSIFMKTEFLDIRKQFMFSKAISLGVATFLKRYAGNVKIKWPNDIYVGDRKICGILVENAVMNGIISHSIVGIGLNINQIEYRSNAPNPVSLKMITGEDYDLEAMLSGVLESNNFYYSMLKDSRFKELDGLFLENLYRFNEVHRYRDEVHEFDGEIIGVNSIGQLMIRENKGKVLQYHFKEVEYLK